MAKRPKPNKCHICGEAVVWHAVCFIHRRMKFVPGDKRCGRGARSLCHNHWIRALTEGIELWLCGIDFQD